MLNQSDVLILMEMINENEFSISHYFHKDCIEVRKEGICDLILENKSLKLGLSSLYPYSSALRF